jgi:hypothetical protein
MSAQKDACRAGMDAFPLPEWNAKQHLEAMDQVGMAVISLSSPDIHWAAAR